MSWLRIAYEELDGDSYGWVIVRLSGLFAGEAGYWGRPDDFRDFADGLSQFPIDPERLPTCDRDNVRFEVKPGDSTGHLWLTLRLVEYHDQIDAVSVRLPVTYAGMQELQTALRRFIQSPRTPIEIELR